MVSDVFMLFLNYHATFLGAANDNLQDDCEDNEIGIFSYNK